MMHPLLTKIRDERRYNHVKTAVRPFTFELLDTDLMNKKYSRVDYPHHLLVMSEYVTDAFLDCAMRCGALNASQYPEDGFLGTYLGFILCTDKYAKPEEKFIPRNCVYYAILDSRQHLREVSAFYAVLSQPQLEAVSVQTKPKPAGKVQQAVQFLGDPSVHESIFWCPEEDIGRGCKNRAHWRIGGESHGGGYGSSSSWLDIGDWIIGHGQDISVIKGFEFDNNWQLAKENG